MYYELRQEIGQNYGVTKWPSFSDVISFQAGSFIKESIAEPIIFEVDNTLANPPTDFPAKHILIFSNRLIKALHETGVDNFQTYRAILINPKTGDKWENYQAVNILGIISCAVLGKSVYTEIMEGLYSFTSLTIDNNKTNNALLFRLAEEPGVILMHVDIAKQMFDENDDARFSGVAFEGIDYI